MSKPQSGELMIVKPIDAPALNVWHISFDSTEKDYIIDVVSPGDVVMVLEQKSYTKILTPRGKMGWVNHSQLLKIT